ncbi:MAG: hypothetical protein LC745_05575 [Planctomycetia bacterium]|nr:hypothetical protein [Planctomycetia bacterium]
MRIHPWFGPSASAVAVSFAVLGLNLAGCGGGDNLPREAVSGTVAVEGKPLKTGLITFLPDSPDVTTQGGGNVIEGKYTIPRDQGLVPGKYKVVVSSPEDKPAEITDKAFNNNAPGMPPTLPKEVIPAQYNDKTLLTAEVTAGGKNVFEFNLITAPAGK